MEEFDRNAYYRWIMDHGIVGLFDEPKVLKSKRTSHWYANFRNAASDVHALEELVHYVLAFARDRGWSNQTFFGVPEGATKLATLLQYENSDDFLFREPTHLISIPSLNEISDAILDVMASLEPDCFIGFPASSDVRELGLITQYKWAKNRPSYGSESHVLPMLRTSAKSHGAAQDREYLGKPRRRIAVIADARSAGIVTALPEYISQLQSDAAIDGEVVGVVYIGGSGSSRVIPDNIQVMSYKGQIKTGTGNPASVVMIEDVTTTGMSSLATIARLNEAEIAVPYLIGLFNRMEVTPVSGVDDSGVVDEFNKWYQAATGQEYPGGMSVADAMDRAGTMYAAMGRAHEFLPMLFRQKNPGPKLVRAVADEFARFGVRQIQL